MAEFSPNPWGNPRDIGRDGCPSGRCLDVIKARTNNLLRTLFRAVEAFAANRNSFADDDRFGQDGVNLGMRFLSSPPSSDLPPRGWR
jgi:hypothetical protein